MSSSLPSPMLRQRLHASDATVDSEEEPPALSMELLWARQRILDHVNQNDHSSRGGVATSFSSKSPRPKRRKPSPESAAARRVMLPHTGLLIDLVPSAVPLDATPSCVCFDDVRGGGGTSPPVVGARQFLTPSVPSDIGGTTIDVTVLDAQRRLKDAGGNQRQLGANYPSTRNVQRRIHSIVHALPPSRLGRLDGVPYDNQGAARSDRRRQDDEQAEAHRLWQEWRTADFDETVRRIADTAAMTLKREVAAVTASGRRRGDMSTSSKKDNFVAADAVSAAFAASDGTPRYNPSRRGADMVSFLEAGPPPRLAPGSTEAGTGRTPPQRSPTPVSPAVCQSIARSKIMSPLPERDDTPPAAAAAAAQRDRGESSSAPQPLTAPKKDAATQRPAALSRGTQASSAQPKHHPQRRRNQEPSRMPATQRITGNCDQHPLPPPPVDYKTMATTDVRRRVTTRLQKKAAPTNGGGATSLPRRKTSSGVAVVVTSFGSEAKVSADDQPPHQRSSAAAAAKDVTNGFDFAAHRPSAAIVDFSSLRAIVENEHQFKAARQHTAVTATHDLGAASPPTSADLNRFGAKPPPPLPIADHVSRRSDPAARNELVSAPTTFSPPSSWRLAIDRDGGGGRRSAASSPGASASVSSQEGPSANGSHLEGRTGGCRRRVPGGGGSGDRGPRRSGRSSVSLSPPSSTAATSAQGRDASVGTTVADGGLDDRDDELLRGRVVLLSLGDLECHRDAEAEEVEDEERVVSHDDRPLAGPRNRRGTKEALALKDASENRPLLLPGDRQQTQWDSQSMGLAVKSASRSHDGGSGGHATDSHLDTRRSDLSVWREQQADTSRVSVLPGAGAVLTPRGKRFLDRTSALLKSSSRLLQLATA